MRVLLRADAAPALGAGHAVRALALAETAAAAGHEVELVGSIDRVPWTAALLERLAVEVSPAPSYADLAAWAADRAADVLHVDDYLAPAGLRQACSTHGVLLSSIEDDRWGRRPSDVVVDPSFGAERRHRPQDGSAAVLLGARYAVVRASVRRARLRADDARPRERGEDHLRVLVVMGGTDAGSALPAVLEALALASADIGAPVSRVRAVSARRPAPISGLDVDWVAPSDDLPDQMADADLVVSAAGTTTAELCCIGTPMALVATADNQLTGYDEVVRRGLALGLSEGTPGLADSSWRTLARALAEPGLRRELAQRASAAVDGAGAARVLRAWEEHAGATAPAGAVPLVARPAAQPDADALLAWRNDPAVRAVSRRSEVIDPLAHRAWLSEVLVSPRRHLLVVEDAAAHALGSVRWDALDESGSWEVSIMLAAHQRGGGRAAAVLRAAEMQLCATEPLASRLIATVHEDNAASRRLFHGQGYDPAGPPDGDGFQVLAKQVQGKGPDVTARPRSGASPC